jgi:hypothetical protein
VPPIPFFPRTPATDSTFTTEPSDARMYAQYAARTKARCHDVDLEHLPECVVIVRENNGFAHARRRC